MRGIRLIDLFLPLTRLPDFETWFKGLQRRLPPRYREAVQ